MSKANNRKAAGLRRSAIAERLQIQQEWSALKGITDNHNPPKQITKRNQNLRRKDENRRKEENGRKEKVKENNIRNCNNDGSSEVLRGCVVLVDVGAESRALALRAALMALGATVVPAWSPIVTHLVWSEGGCRATRAKARALASRLVSPLWVEACAASNKRLPEQTFPAAARASDLPSPRTLRQMLKRAEMENIPLVNLLQDSKDGDKEQRAPRLRLSTDTDNDTTDTSRDTTHTPDIESRVNTAPRRALPATPVTPLPAKSRRKLFTHKEVDDVDISDDTDAESRLAGPKTTQSKLTQRERRDLAVAERMARRLAAARTPKKNENNNNIVAHSCDVPRIVLTGMSRTKRHAIYNAIRKLNGKVQTHVNKRTTHVILGSCCHSNDDSNAFKVTPKNKYDNVRRSPRINSAKNNSDFNISGVTRNLTSSKMDSPEKNIMDKIENRLACLENPIKNYAMFKSDKVRTLNALLGAARGCRILNVQWVEDSVKADKWLHHHGYEIPHLKKISLKARIERKALDRQHTDHAYDVFNGMRVSVSPNTEQKDAAIQLLKLCGAIVIEQNGVQIQHGGIKDGATLNADFDMTLGARVGEVGSKWVFDSVAAARMRTTRRYIN